MKRIKKPQPPMTPFLDVAFCDILWHASHLARKLLGKATAKQRTPVPKASGSSTIRRKEDSAAGWRSEEQFEEFLEISWSRSAT